LSTLLPLYVTRCPVGCPPALQATAIVLPEGPLRRCPECGQLVSSADSQRYEETMKQFNAPDFNQPQGRELGRRQGVAARRLRRIAALLEREPAGIRILDVGCSRGQFVEAARDLGFQAEGVEPAPRIAAAAQAAGLTVHQGLLEDLHFLEASYDALTLFEVLEHLREPLTLLAEARRVLRPRGILLLSTANADSWSAHCMGARWDYFDMARDGGHISFFNPRSVALLAQRAGFRVERIETGRVKFHDRADAPRLIYTAGKLFAELLNVPARLAGKGHDMVAYLRRQ